MAYSFTDLEEVRNVIRAKLDTAERRAKYHQDMVTKYDDKSLLDWQQEQAKRSARAAGGINHVKTRLASEKSTVRALNDVLDMLAGMTAVPAVPTEPTVPAVPAVPAHTEPASSYKPLSPDTAECPWCLKLVKASARQDVEGYLICVPCARHYSLTGCRSFNPGRWAAPGNLTLYCESCDQDILEEDVADVDPADGHQAKIDRAVETFKSMVPVMESINRILIPDCDYCGAVGESQHSPTCLNA